MEDRQTFLQKCTKELQWNQKDLGYISELKICLPYNTSKLIKIVLKRSKRRISRVNSKQKIENLLLQDQSLARKEMKKWSLNLARIAKFLIKLTLVRGSQSSGLAMITIANIWCPAAKEEEWAKIHRCLLLMMSQRILKRETRD